MAKRYKCPYCELRLIRKDLIKHIDKKHEELIPQGYSSARLVYNQVNKIDHGKCRVCGKLTSWNEKSGRYNVLCDNPKCKEHMREEYKKNMLRVRGTYNILNDPEQQKKMLANRSISGSYKFSDGGILTYTGSYEKKCLEFMDVVMQIPSKDILSPGPTIEYEYNGSKHFYITDFYYIPYNLIIEVKDGGDNLNNKDSSSMRASREKTIEKERIITDRGEYNYIRLTNNDFSQLLDVFMTIKEKLLEGDVSKTYKINESVINDYFIEGNIISKIKNALKIDTNTKFNIHKASISDFNKFYNNNDFFIESLFDKESDLTDEKAQIIANNIASINISIKYKTVDIYLIKNSLLNNKYDLHKSNKFNDKSYSIVFPLNLFRSNEHHYVKELFHARYFNDVIDNREYREVKMGYHKMSPQVQWLADIDNNHKINESVIFESTHSKYDIENQVKRIAEKVKKDKKDPTGNQNCMLCTWCMEAWFRGYNILPRPVYSPIDKIFDFEGYDIIKRPTKITIENKDDIKKFVLIAGDGSRFYVHFKWKNGNGGHEFLIINIHDEIYLLDAQSNIFEKITSPKVSSYFRDVDYEKSFIVRVDDKEINTSMLKYNDMEPKEFTPEDMKYTTESVIFSTDNIEYNTDTLKPNSDNNILFITGFSGSGKSTLMVNLKEKYGNNIITIAGDTFFMVCLYKYRMANTTTELKNVNKFDFSRESCKSYIGPVLKRYFDIYYKDINLSNGKFSNKELFVYWEHFINWLYNDVKENASLYRNKIIVVEGIQIYVTNPELYKDHALIITGTSMLKSYFRKTKRDIISDKKYDWKHIKTLFTMIPVYLNDIGNLNRLKRTMSESDNNINILDETSLTEACKDIDTARKFLQDVDNLSKKYDANFFIVTDGASMTRNGRGKSEPAVKNARDSQIEWEKKNGGDPDEDWLKHTNESNNYIKNFTEDDMKYIDESTGYNHYSKDVHTIIDNLSEKEYQYINGGQWVDSNHIIYRKVEYLNNKPVGFIDVYSLPKFDKNIGLVVLAVAKEARGKGIGSKLVREAIFNHKENKDINKLRWLADSDNKASINMAKSLGFDLISDNKNKKEFIYNLNKSSINEACIVNVSNTFIQTYIRLFVDYIYKKYKSNVDTIDIKIVYSKQAIEMKKKKLKYNNYSNDFIVINYNEITIIDEETYGDQPINYNSFLKFHITKVLLSTYACDDNTRLINAICTYESGIYNEIGEKTSELKDAAIYAEYLNKYGPNMVVNNLIKRSHTQYPIF